MIFNEGLIFVHIGKTGGMSCSEYLLRNLRTPVFNCHEDAREDLERIGRKGVIPRADILRHSTLAESLEYISRFNGKSLADFAKIVVVIRHPYTLEYSLYKHLQKPAVIKRRKADRTDRDLALANGDFRIFVEKADYHRCGHSQDAFFRIQGDVPDSVELVRFEDLSTAFPRAVSRYLEHEATRSFPHHNRTEYECDVSCELTEEVKELIYEKHRYMFDSGLYSTD
jgi:hypothetical protein